jgi:hypothetical protein
VFVFPIIVVVVAFSIHYHAPERKNINVRSLCIESANKNTEKKEII